MRFVLCLCVLVVHHFLDLIYSSRAEKSLIFISAAGLVGLAKPSGESKVLAHGEA